MGSRLKAALVALLLSLVVLALVSVAVIFTWFPPPYLPLLHIGQSLLINLSLVVGGVAVLVAVVWKPGKRGLRFDLWVIALLQLAAYGWCLSELRLDRPIYTVFAVDRFNVLAGNEKETLVGAPPPAVPWRGPLLVAAHVPTDPAAYDRLLDETLFEGKPDIDRRPEYWSTFSASAAQVLSTGRSLRALVAANPEIDAEAARAARALGVELATLRFLPMVGPRSDYAAVLDPESAEPAALIAVNPWLGP